MSTPDLKHIELRWLFQPEMIQFFGSQTHRWDHKVSVRKQLNHCCPLFVACEAF